MPLGTTVLEDRAGVDGAMHHNEGWTLTHDTRVEDLSWACWHCHDLKTGHDLRFVGPPGQRSFATCDGTTWYGPGDSEPEPAEAPVQDDLFTLAT